MGIGKKLNEIARSLDLPEQDETAVEEMFEEWLYRPPPCDHAWEDTGGRHTWDAFHYAPMQRCSRCGEVRADWSRKVPYPYP